MIFSKLQLIAGMLMMAGLTAPASGEAQQDSSRRAAQFTFVTPLGTNWTQAGSFTNDFSLNLLVGFNGGLDGVEFSGLAGLLKGDMSGVQFAGLVNTAGGNVRGLQAAGLVNVGGGTLNGLQLSGLTSIQGGDIRGAQISGLAGIGGNSMQGAQISGLVSVAGDTLKGIQINGLAGIVTGSIKGAQISGLFNYAKTLDGVQIGLFNYADTIRKGVPIGLFSIVGHGGYYAFELVAGETFYGTASFKMGVKKFYNIFSLGAAYRNEMIIWGWGAGFGTLFQLGKKVDLSVEAVCYQVNLGEWFTHGPNLLSKVNLSVGWHVARHVALVFTPSWNVTIMDMTDEYGQKTRKSFAPYWVYDKTWSNDMNLKMYPGLSVGVRF